MLCNHNGQTSFSFKGFNGTQNGSCRDDQQSLKIENMKESKIYPLLLGFAQQSSAAW